MIETLEIERLKAEIADLSGQLTALQDALLAERFKDVPRLAIGDIVLVPRKLFGKVKWWRAQIVYVYLEYSSGTMDGRPWEKHLVSYSVCLQQKDDTFGGDTQGYYAGEVQPVPEAGS
jgi:hypothetical protein